MKIFIALPKIISLSTIEKMRSYLEKNNYDPIFSYDIEYINIRQYFEATCKIMSECQILLADLTPFLGIEPDPDVIFQLGYMAAQNKIIFSYLNILDNFYNRVRKWNGQDFICDGILERDYDDMRIEDMGIRDQSICIKEDVNIDNYHNLMLEGHCLSSQIRMLTSKDAGIKISDYAIYTDLSVFYKTVDEIKKKFSGKKNNTLVNNSNMILENEWRNGVYLAGPDIFLPNFDKHFDQKKRLLDEIGLKGVAPTDSQLDFEEMQKWAFKNGNNPKMRQEIYKNDIKLINSSCIGVFNLTSFHGATADSGSIFEMGYMTGKDYKLNRELKIFAYSNNSKNLNERIEEWGRYPHGFKYGTREINAYMQTSGELLYSEHVIYSLLVDGAVIAGDNSLHNRLTNKQEKMLIKSEKFSCLIAYQLMVEEMRRKQRI